MSKKIRIILIILSCFLAVAIIGVAYLGLAFPKVSDAPELTVAGTETQIARGEYLANHDCRLY